MVPLQMLIDSGFEVVAASPMGTAPVIDPISDSAVWFAGDASVYNRYRASCVQLGLCVGKASGSLKTKSFHDIAAEGLEGYSALFVPGGHAPMGDLARNLDLAQILKHFHDQRKPTALICHGPVALLSALTHATEYAESLENLTRATALRQTDKIQSLNKRISELAKDWIYRDYRMTVFSTKEEQQQEPGGSSNALGGFVSFYPDESLALAGGKVVVTALKWQSHVVQDRELITAQNPSSDHEFANLLLASVKQYLVTKNQINNRSSDRK